MSFRSVVFASMPLLLGWSLGCGIISETKTDLEIKVAFDVETNACNTPNQGGGTLCTEDFTVDPNENPDVKEYRDNLDGMVIKAVELELLNFIGEGLNQATLGSGLVCVVTTADQDCSANPFASFNDVPIFVGQKFRLTLTPAQRAAIADFLFNSTGPITLLFVGTADGPLSARLQATFILDIDFSVP